MPALDSEGAEALRMLYNRAELGSKDKNRVCASSFGRTGHLLVDLCAAAWTKKCKGKG